MVIYATTAGGISVGSLFLAGYLPGALLAIVLMIGSYIISVKENYPKGSPFSIKGFVKQLGTSIWHWPLLLSLCSALLAVCSPLPSLQLLQLSTLCSCRCSSTRVWTGRVSGMHWMSA